MARKRSSSEMADVLVLDSSCLHDQAAATALLRSHSAGGSGGKRQAQRAGGEMSQREVQAWIDTLSRRFPSCPSALQRASSLDASGWQALAELNVLLSAHWGSLPSSALAGFHAFTIKDRASLWAAYAAHQGCPQAASAGLDPASPRHLQLLRFLLEWVLSPYPQASITCYTIQLPSWLVGWASRWGWASPTVSLIVLQAYAPLDPSSSSRAQTAQPRRTAMQIFVPLLP